MNEKEAMKRIIRIVRVIAEAKARFESKDDRITMDDLQKYAEGFGQSLDDLQDVISCVLDRPSEAPEEDKTEQFANVGKKILEELKKLRTPLPLLFLRHHLRSDQRPQGSGRQDPRLGLRQEGARDPDPLLLQGSFPRSSVDPDSGRRAHPARSPAQLKRILPRKKRGLLKGKRSLSFRSGRQIVGRIVFI